VSYDLKIERLIDAPPEEVFNAFVDPEANKQWYADRPEDTVTSTCDLRVGGMWSVSFGPSPDVQYREDNEFVEVQPPHRLAYSSWFTNADGRKFHTDLVVTFEDQGGKTLLTILQTGFESEKDRNDHQGGWPGFIDRLERLVTTGSAR
jgi:uncharacterized protein YndB with AHSA1/START domain